MKKATKKNKKNNSNIQANGYWNSQCDVYSPLLWLPCVNTLSSLDIDKIPPTLDGTWFTAISYHFNQPVNLDVSISPIYQQKIDEEEFEISNKTVKIRMRPTAPQRIIIRRWEAGHRYVYNETVKYLRCPDTIAEWMEIKTWLLPTMPDWILNIPYQIKVGAVKEACKAVKSAKKKYKKTKQFQNVKFKSCKDVSQTIFIPKSAITNKGIYTRVLKKMKYSERLPDIINDSALTHEKGRYYLEVSTKLKLATTDIDDNLFEELADDNNENIGVIIRDSLKVVAVDPGIRTFLTYYSQDSCGKLASGDFSRIQGLCIHMDKLISKKRLEKKRNKRQKLQDAINRMKYKISDLIDELHHKSALFLVRNFDIILIPKFETSNMVKKSSRNIKSKSVRNMLTFAHYRFQQFLKFKAFQYGKAVININESYTSKTCSWNGKVKNITSAKFIKDNKVKLDRDYNGSRGIFLRGLCEMTPALSCQILNVA